MTVRSVVGSLSGAVTASQRLTLYQDVSTANQQHGSLKQRGFRQLSIQIQNTATMTFELSITQDGGTSYVMFDTFTVPVYSSTNKNQYAYDLTALENVLVQLVDTGSGQGSTFRAIAEALADAEDVGCANA